MLLKFTGKFNELKPAGYTFQKLYARNYRCYHKEVGPGDTIWIWQHMGGYVEFNDLHDLSAMIARAIILQQLLPDDAHSFAFDIVTRSLVAYKYDLHEPIFVHLNKQKELGRKLTDAEVTEICAYCERWRRVPVSPSLCAAILDLHAKGWIKMETT